MAPKSKQDQEMDDVFDAFTEQLSESAGSSKAPALPQSASEVTASSSLRVGGGGAGIPSSKNSNDEKHKA